MTDHVDGQQAKLGNSESKMTISGLPPLPPESAPSNLHRTSPHLTSKPGLSRSDRSSSFSKSNVLRTSKNVQVTLSRPFYKPGSVVVGTIRVLDEGGEPSQQQGSVIGKTGMSFESASFFALGYCRLDNRWHKRNSNYANNYSMHYFNDQNDGTDEQFTFDRKRLPKDLPERECVFWAAVPEGVDLVRVAESTAMAPGWETMRPQPVKYSESWADESDRSPSPPHAHFSATAEGARHSSSQSFTFRTNLPRNVPGTLIAMSCRYSYNLLLRLQSYSGAVTWIETPVLVQQQHQSIMSFPAISGNRPTLGSPSLLVKSHTGILPCSLTPTELFEASPEYQKGSLTVHRFSAAFHCSSTTGPVLRIADPNHKQHVAVLTLLAPIEVPAPGEDDSSSTGSTSVCLCPGSRLILQFDFPGKVAKSLPNGNSDSNEDSRIPCYQVSCCLQGSESVLSYDSVSSARGEAKSMQQGSSHAGNPTFKQKRHFAQQMLLATAHQVVDPETTERTSLSLLVPDNTLCSTKTPTVEISYTCIVDIVVASPPPASSLQPQKRPPLPKYRNLRLQVPCTIGHAPTAMETMAQEMKDPEDVALLQRQQMLWEERNNMNDTVEVFPSEDIQDDLKRLSIITAEENNWTQQAAP